MHINWQFKSLAQTTFNWSGHLVSGDTISVTIGSKFFPFDTNNSITVWTSLPNGATDLVTSNDSISVNHLYPGLGGTYTIGGSSPDFINFTDAITSLKLGGILGNVVFNVRNGTYSEQLEIPAISGTSASKTITFQSQSGDSSSVTLTFTGTYSNNYVVALNGANYIIFKK